jgi:hypothetical protein
LPDDPPADPVAFDAWFKAQHKNWAATLRGIGSPLDAKDIEERLPVALRTGTLSVRERRLAVLAIMQDEYAEHVLGGGPPEAGVAPEAHTAAAVPSPPREPASDNSAMPWDEKPPPAVCPDCRRDLPSIKLRPDHRCSGCGAKHDQPDKPGQRTFAEASQPREPGEDG